MPTPTLTDEIILAAIDGLESRKANIDAQIADLRAMLTGSAAQPTDEMKAAGGTTALARPRRKISAAARKRMAEGQRKRRAAERGEAPATAPNAAKSKRRLSAAGRARIVASTKRYWAAKRAEAARANREN